MSVYTAVPSADLEKFLRLYDVGELLDYSGITEGIENTNYFVNTKQGKFVLTLFESVNQDILPYYVELMAYFNEHGIPSAHPIADSNKNYLQLLKGKPAILMQRLTGAWKKQPDVQHCEIIGNMLARLHITGQGFPKVQTDPRGRKWRYQISAKLLDRLTKHDAELLRNELTAQAEVNEKLLPCGVIHADLFRDNVLFHDGKLTGILDFYNACNDSLLYDLAITVNDWCVESDGRLDLHRTAVLCQAYAATRVVTPQEIIMWPLMLRIAALRFWLSRLWSYYHPAPGVLTFVKDPEEFRRILLYRKSEESVLKDVWR